MLPTTPKILQMLYLDERRKRIELEKRIEKLNECIDTLVAKNSELKKKDGYSEYEFISIHEKLNF